MSEAGSPTVITCPRCGGAVLPDGQFCPHCGVNLGMAAALVEQMVGALLTPDIPAEALTLDTLAPRLGERLIEAGLITPQQLEEALAYQHESAREGSPLRLGHVLVKLGFIDRDTLDREVVEIILQLQNALRQANARLEHKVAERTRQLRKALEHLAELRRLKDNFIANVSHELRTPLTHLMGYLELMSDGAFGTLTIEQRQAVEMMEKSADRLLYLIEDLISFSLLARGLLSLEVEAAAVDQIVEHALATIEPRIKAKPLAFVKEIVPSLWVLADSEKIRWALQHILDNAVKFTPPDGTIVFRVWPEDGFVHFLVADTGIGIAREHIPLIFEPFVQLEDASRRRYGGTGLGLALVKQILDAHDVRLDVTSELGRGTTIHFALAQTPHGRNERSP